MNPQIQWPQHQRWLKCIPDPHPLIKHLITFVPDPRISTRQSFYIRDPTLLCCLTHPSNSDPALHGQLDDKAHSGKGEKALIVQHIWLYLTSKYCSSMEYKLLQVLRNVSCEVNPLMDLFDYVLILVLIL